MKQRQATLFPECINFPSNPKGEEIMYEIPNRYEVPDIIYEGELEVQAGSPVGMPEWDDVLDEL